MTARASAYNERVLRYPDGREKCLECGAWFKSGWETPTDA